MVPNETYARAINLWTWLHQRDLEGYSPVDSKVTIRPGPEYSGLVVEWRFVDYQYRYSKMIPIHICTSEDIIDYILDEAAHEMKTLVEKTATRQENEIK